jgi:hypothetical protein
VKVKFSCDELLCNTKRPPKVCRRSSAIMDYLCHHNGTNRDIDMHTYIHIYIIYMYLSVSRPGGRTAHHLAVRMQKDGGTKTHHASSR